MVARSGQGFAEAVSGPVERRQATKAKGGRAPSFPMAEPRRTPLQGCDPERIPEGADGPDQSTQNTLEIFPKYLKCRCILSAR